MAKDPYKYFRVEAAELLDNLTRGVLELEKGAPDRDMVAGLLRLAHTLKGASQVVKQPAIAQTAHAIEDILGPYRTQEAPVPKERTGALMHLLDEIGIRLTDLGASPPAGPAPRAPEASETVRVEVEEVDQLLGSLAEASVDLTAIQSEAGALRRARQAAARVVQQIQAGLAGDLHGGVRLRASSDELLNALAVSERRISAVVERAERELGQARDRANRLRLIPAQTIFPSLARTAREAATALGKQVDFDATGGSVRLDAQILTAIRDALLHLVRNAVAHGIEAEAERVSAGKPCAGRITIEIRQSGSVATFCCRDDGRGMDLAAIRRVAVERGVISETDAAGLGFKEIIDLILKGGLSTTPVTRISGRGIGLDVVRDAVARLKGEIRVETESGRGTAMEIWVPVSLASVAALLVQTAGITAAVPLESVQRTLRLQPGEVAEAGTGRSIVHGGRAMSFLRLSEALGGSAEAGNGSESRTAVIIGSGTEAAAIGVGRLLGTAVILVRSLPALAAADPVAAGAALDAEGNPLLVLDPKRLIEKARSMRPAEAREAGVPRAPILIIDDSLTTRMVEQSVLESAGHRVECATSGEEAMEKAHQRRYSLFLVDVEMPGMDGYQFVARAHDDPLLREIPAILVTSRSSAADRKRGQEAGARAYIAKSEFDQGQFLETIRRLVA